MSKREYLAWHLVAFESGLIVGKLLIDMGVL